VTKVHFIGVCGTAMATVAILLKQRGLEVRGSDEHTYAPMSDVLARHGIEPLEGYSAEHIAPDVDLVVVGNAVSRGNPEVEWVLEKRIRYCSLPEIVRDQFLWERLPVVVAGTHGKTTTAFMTAWALSESGRDPSFLIGGVSKNFLTSGQLGNGKPFVIEGDEYDSAFFDKTAKFLKYLPHIVVVNNIEFDHADIYSDLKELRLAFTRLVNLIPRDGQLLLCADNAEAAGLAVSAKCAVETFGLAASADWRADKICHQSASTTFDVVHGGQLVGSVNLPLLGVFNIRNALGSIAAAVRVGASESDVLNALEEFCGVRRRLELRGVARGVAVYDDFAHHPTAVRETLEGLRAAAFARRIWAVFEPRSATACRKVFQSEFVDALQLADEVIVADVYRTALPDVESLSERELVSRLSQRGVSARHVSGVDSIISLLSSEARDGDLVVIMSNGDFEGIHGRVLSRLAASV
jgi:UDP-N-acetylmuramate: L-alanyl-gamma-D-glutamyl-meso-diaminopimelate ligase